MSHPHKRPSVDSPPPPRRRRAPRWLAVAGGALLAAVALLAWGLSESRASRNRGEAAAAAPRESQPDASTLDREFAALAENRVLTAEELQRLQRQLERERERLRAPDPAGAGERRLQNLESLYAAAELRSLLDRTRATERTARAALAAGDGAAGVAQLRAAAELQRLINQRPGATVGRDLAREATLQFEIERLEAEPLAAELGRATAEADRWRDAGRPTEALAAYQLAHGLQLRLNREFGRTSFASIQNLELIEVEIATLGSAPLFAEVMAASAEAADAQARGDNTGAVTQFERAAAAQQRINLDFPRSRQVSTERLATLEIARQTELSTGPALRVAELDRKITAKLRARDHADLAELLQEGAGLQDALFARFPRSRRLDPELRLKFSYLVLRRGDLGAVAATIESGLRPLPGSGVRLLRSEISQRLYELVMRTNPSRQPAPDLPVESVSADEATEFCRRLGWLLGRPVRLPTLAEYRAALGSPVVADFAAQVWSRERSAGVPHPVSTSAANPLGFQDLLGNVAEWLAPSSPATPQAPVAGGSYADSDAALAEVPIVELGRLDRARTIGFRVVVE